MASPVQGEGIFHRSPARRTGIAGETRVLEPARAADQSGDPAGTPEPPQLTPHSPPGMERPTLEIPGHSLTTLPTGTDNLSLNVPGREGTSQPGPRKFSLILQNSSVRR